MEIVRDLVGGDPPPALELFYCQQDDADASETRYKGSLVKLMDWNNANGIQCCWAGETTIYENIIGLLAEAPGIDGNLLNSSTAPKGAVTKKIIPLLPSSIVRGEYARSDPAGTSILDTNFTGDAASTSLTCADLITTADLMIGGWVYFTNGANEGYLHYITDNDTSGVLTLATAAAGATVATDDLIVIQSANTLWMQLDTQYVNLVSNVEDTARTLPVVGLMTYISAPGRQFERLDRNIHDGLKITNARFYHDFIIGGSATLGNVWRDTVVRA